MRTREEWLACLRRLGRHINEPPASTPQAAKARGITDLPREICDIIYGYAAIQEEENLVRPLVAERSADGERALRIWKEPALLRTSTALRSQFAPAYYKNGNFSIVVHIPEDLKPLIAWLRNVASLGDQDNEQMSFRSLTIDVEFAGWNDYVAFEGLWEFLCTTSMDLKISRQNDLFVNWPEEDLEWNGPVDTFNHLKDVACDMREQGITGPALKDHYLQALDNIELFHPEIKLWWDAMKVYQQKQEIENCLIAQGFRENEEEKVDAFDKAGEMALYKRVERDNPDAKSWARLIVEALDNNRLARLQED